MPCYKWIKLEKEHIKTMRSSPIANQSEQEPFKFTNNFDNRFDSDKVYKYFKTELFDTGYLFKEDFKSYLKMAFQEEIFPTDSERFVMNGNPDISDVMLIFYNFFNLATGRKKGKSTLYSSLLGKYFKGYTTENTRTNWANKSKKATKFK